MNNSHKKTRRYKKKGSGITQSKQEKPLTPPKYTRKNVNFSPRTKSEPSPKQNKTKKMFISRNKEKQKAVTQYYNRQEQQDLLDMALGKKPLKGGNKRKTKRKYKGGNGDDKKRTILNSNINDDSSAKKHRKSDISPRSVTDVRSTNPSPTNIEPVMKGLSLKLPSDRALNKIEEEKALIKRKKEITEFRQRKAQETYEKMMREREEEAEKKNKERKEAIMKLRKEMEEKNKKDQVNWNKLTSKEKLAKRREIDLKKHKKEEQEMDREKERLVQKKISENYNKKMYLEPEEPLLGRIAYPYGQPITRYRDDYGEGIIFGGKKKYKYKGGQNPDEGETTKEDDSFDLSLSGINFDDSFASRSSTESNASHNRFVRRLNQRPQRPQRHQNTQARYLAQQHYLEMDEDLNLSSDSDNE